ncbi:MAG: hypothetical protein LBE80_02715 [Deltaproteobacteria bacterium]|nr:hypothetical protein [Deltaproteobacteria bacterium]
MKKSFLSVLLMALLALALPTMALAQWRANGEQKKYIPAEQRRIQSNQRASQNGSARSQKKNINNHRSDSQKGHQIDRRPSPPIKPKPIHPGPPKRPGPKPIHPRPPGKPRPRPHSPRDNGPRVEREIVYLPSEPVYYESGDYGDPEASPSFSFGLDDGAGNSVNFGAGGGGFGFGINLSGNNY